MKSNNKGQEMTFTAKIETVVDDEVVNRTSVGFWSRQNAIDYVWPFYVARKNVYREYQVHIVRSDGVVLHAPDFGKSHYGS